MKKQLEISKSLGMSLLLFVLLSAVAISEDSREITVTIVESSSSEDSTEKTVVTTSDSGSGLTETTEVFGEDSTTTVVTDPEDNGNNGDPVPETPDSQPDDLVIEEFNADWFKSILAMLDEEEPLSTIDLMQESTDTDSFE